MKFFLFFLIVILLLQSFTEAITVTNYEDSAGVKSLNHQARKVEEIGDQESSLVKKIPPHKKINCRYACARRCRVSSRKKVCIRACGTCCSKCHCVPPGTNGNHKVCPCYARLKTHGNKLKCP